MLMRAATVVRLAGLVLCFIACFILLVITPLVIARVHRVHAMNAEQRQLAADLWTKPTYLSHKPACRQLGHYIHHLLLQFKS